MKLRREEWERVAANYETMGRPSWAERILRIVRASKRVNISIDLMWIARGD